MGLFKDLMVGLLQDAAQSQGYAPTAQAPGRAPAGGSLSRAAARAPALRPIPTVAPCKCDK